MSLSGDLGIQWSRYLKTKHQDEKRSETKKLSFPTGIDGHDLPPRTPFANPRNTAKLGSPGDLILGFSSGDAYLSFPEQIVRMSAGFHTAR